MGHGNETENCREKFVVVIALGSDCLGVNIRGGAGGGGNTIVLGGNCPGELPRGQSSEIEIVRGELSGEQLSSEQVPRGELS